MKYCQGILKILGYHMVKIRTLYLTWTWIGTGSWRTDRWTDRQTDGQNYHS